MTYQPYIIHIDTEQVFCVTRHHQELLQTLPIESKQHCHKNSTHGHGNNMTQPTTTLGCFRQYNKHTSKNPYHSFWSVNVRRAPDCSSNLCPPKI